MNLPSDPKIRAVLAQMKAEEFRAYIERRNQRRPDDLVTVRRLCQRFRMCQADVVACIEEGGSGLTVSEFAYIPPPKEDRDGSRGWGKLLLCRFVPQLAPDAPIGARLVSIID